MTTGVTATQSTTSSMFASVKSVANAALAKIISVIQLVYKNALVPMFKWIATHPYVTAAVVIVATSAVVYTKIPSVQKAVNEAFKTLTGAEANTPNSNQTRADEKNPTK